MARFPLAFQGRARLRWRSPRRGSAGCSAARRGRGAPRRSSGGLPPAASRRAAIRASTCARSRIHPRRAPRRGRDPWPRGVGELLADLHHLHQEVGRRLGLARLTHRDAGAGEERLGAAHRILERAERLVHVDGAAQRHASLGRGRAGVAVRVQRARQIAVALLERRGDRARSAARRRASRRDRALRRADPLTQCLDGEAVAAPAARGLVGVLEFEPLEHERLFVIEHRAAQVEHALLVAEDAHPGLALLVVLEDQVAAARRPVLELDRVAEPRAAAALDADADGRVGRAALRELRPDRLDRGRADGDRLLGDPGVELLDGLEARALRRVLARCSSSSSLPLLRRCAAVSAPRFGSASDAAASGRSWPPAWRESRRSRS